MRVERIYKWTSYLLFLSLSILNVHANQGDDAVVSPSSPSEYLPDYLLNERLLRFDSNSTVAEREALLKEIGAEVIAVSTRTEWVRVRVLEQAQMAPAKLQANGLVERAGLNPTARAFGVPNDPYWQLQWNLGDSKQGGINMVSAWDIATGEGAVVAVLDTGIAYEDYESYRLISDLAETRFVAGYDFVEDDAHPNDDNGHGTHVAGTIAQSTNNGIGGAGVAPNASIMPVKVLDESALGDYFTISEGIYYAVDQGAQIINLSLGGAISSPILEEAVRYAYERGVILVAAMGNEYQRSNPTMYPAAYKETIAVGASNSYGERSDYSSTGSHIDLVAPGGSISIDRNRDGYADGILQQTIGQSSLRSRFYFLEGTSMAAPHVAGVAALLISHGITESSEIREALLETALDIGRTGWDMETGAGLVDAYAALGYTPSPSKLEIADEATVDVQEALPKQGTELYAAVRQGQQVSKNGWEIQLQITVRDEFQQGVSGAEVIIDWRYDGKFERSRMFTDENGVVEIGSGMLPRWMSVAYYKRGATKDGYRFVRFTSRLSSQSVNASDGAVFVSSPQPLVLEQSYPNPSNPETWIPFRLGTSASVSIEIYSVNGRRVRTLELGTLTPGNYTARDRAAYWNGTNNQGERVASGAYFYTLRAGSYHVTRRLLLAR